MICIFIYRTWYAWKHTKLGYIVYIRHLSHCVTHKEFEAPYQKRRLKHANATTCNRYTWNGSLSFSPVPPHTAIHHIQQIIPNSAPCQIDTFFMTANDVLYTDLTVSSYHSVESIRRDGIHTIDAMSCNIWRFCFQLDWADTTWRGLTWRQRQSHSGGFGRLIYPPDDLSWPAVTKWIYFNWKFTCASSFRVARFRITIMTGSVV